MAIKSERVSVTTTATLLSSPEADRVAGSTVTGRVPALGNSVSLVGANVTTGGGYEFTPGESLRIDINQADDILYGVVGAGSQTVHVFESGL